MSIRNRIIRWTRRNVLCPICDKKIYKHGLWESQKCLEELEKKK